MGSPEVAVTVPATEPTVTLRYSDDQGNTFTDGGTLTIEPCNFTQELQWLSLGIIQSPVRIFEVTDVGAVARLQGADAEVDDG